MIHIHTQTRGRKVRNACTPNCSLLILHIPDLSFQFQTCFLNPTTSCSNNRPEIRKYILRTSKVAKASDHIQNSKSMNDCFFLLCRPRSTTYRRMMWTSIMTKFGYVAARLSHFLAWQKCCIQLISLTLLLDNETRHSMDITIQNTKLTHNTHAFASPYLLVAFWPVSVWWENQGMCYIFQHRTYTEEERFVAGDERAGTSPEEKAIC